MNNFADLYSHFFPPLVIFAVMATTVAMAYAATMLPILIINLLYAAPAKGIPEANEDEFFTMVGAEWAKEETLATEFRNVVMGAPATEEGDKDANFYANLITWYPADRKTGTLFHDGWSGYENIVKTLTLYGFHARDIIKLPIGWKYPYYADCRYNDGLLAHAEAFKRAYYQRRHILKLARRKYMKQRKRDRIRWIDYGWAKAKREWARFEREMVVREAPK